MSVKCEVIENKDGTHRVQTSVDGRAVSWLTIIDLKMHYGASRVDVGGIAGVYTEREFRGRGYSKRTMNHALEWMRSREYPLTALFGIHEYYHRYGFATFMGEHHARISLRNLSKVGAPDGYQVVLHDDPGYRSEDIAKLYEGANIDRIASRVRDPSSWKGFRKGVVWEHSPRVLVAEDRGRVIGYAVVERWPPPDELPIAEINALNHSYSIYRSLLKEIYRIMAEDLKTSAVFYVPPDHPLVNVLKTYGCRFESSYPWRGDGMARVLNLKLLLASIEAELKRRSKGVNGAVCIKLPDETVTLIVDDGSVEVKEGVHTVNVVKLGYGEAAQLILGYRNPYELLSMVEMHGNVGILAKLFPSRIPYVWQPDRW
ncbi:GNAT family N-acetyltransferase [Candidatus Bathyarchaeota archaeon]|nr:MAG: GNAT family N-acetyltransferase [Candidatus Bathyarchaeota archaeon]